MKEAIFALFAVLSFNQVLILIGFIVVCVLAFMLTLDKMNVKSFSFTKGFTFYQDGETKKSRVTRREKVVRRKVK